MRRNSLVASAVVALAAPGLVIAQTPSRTTDDYVCAFSGQCEDQQKAGEAVAEPAEGAPRGTPRTSSTRGFSLAKPNGAQPAKSASKAPAPKAKGTRPAQQAAARPNNRPKAAPAAAAGQRADLRLSFELGSASLTPVARAEARVFAESLMRPELKDMRFLIEGHTDAQGGRAYNLDLSQRRAAAVADYLASLGVDRSRLQVRGYGFDRPLPGRSASAQENRRVEAVRVS
jgi:OmpA-OmpF porin, OOP family